jgi:hypothetical protein
MFSVLVAAILLANVDLAAADDGNHPTKISCAAADTAGHAFIPPPEDAGGFLACTYVNIGTCGYSSSVSASALLPASMLAKPSKERLFLFQRSVVSELGSTSIHVLQGRFGGVPDGWVSRSFDSDIYTNR